MKVLIIGSGISGLTAAIASADMGNHVVLVSPYPSERAQSVMAAGGINAAADLLHHRWEGFAWRYNRSGQRVCIQSGHE